MIEIGWSASPSASCLHAAAALARGQKLVDAKLADALAEPVTRLANALPSDAPLRQRCWENLEALSASVANNRLLATTALAKAVGRGQSTNECEMRLAGSIDSLEAAFALALPEVKDELMLRGEPLRQQWEARGPGLLTTVGQFTEPELIVPRAEVVLVYPALGGGGTAHLSYNTVTIEAVLVNVEPTLPEVARLGWLIAQLHQDVPIYSESIPQQRLNRVAALAMLPPALLAAEEVELVTYKPATLHTALVAWLRESPTTVESLAARLSNWWETFCAARPRWAVALASLDAMLA